MGMSLSLEWQACALVWNYYRFVLGIPVEIEAIIAIALDSTTQGMEMRRLRVEGVSHILVVTIESKRII